ncbi:MAG: hypothetical protein ACRDKI_07410 [Solirubrobacterales bacterium]
MTSGPRDARQEAFDRIGGRYEVRVLEPSPPAVSAEPWFADDPAARGEVPAGTELVSPVTKGDLMWSDLFDDFEGLAGWARERWLTGDQPLPPLPAALIETRLALHRLAENVISPAREKANGKIGLRFTFGGFGTPYFGDDEQLRVQGDRLIRESRAGSSEEQLDVDAAASAFLGDWFGFTCNVLEQLRAEAGPELEASRVQLWPEHFDLATEFGAEADGERAGYGGSPGDELHPEPYLYVVPWDQSHAEGDAWNSEAFKGAELSYAQLLESAAPRELALDFFRSRLQLLAG